jgi:hypothetical protein
VLTPSTEPLAADVVAPFPAVFPAQPQGIRAGSVHAQPPLSSPRGVGGSTSQYAGQTPAPSAPVAAEQRFSPLLPVDASRPPPSAGAFDRSGNWPAVPAFRRAGVRPPSDAGQSQALAVPVEAEPRLSSLHPVEAPRPPLHDRVIESLSPPEAQAIRVTIGRIEVRAVQFPPPPPARVRPALPGPTLSLQDYLKQRNEGKR